MLYTKIENNQATTNVRTLEYFVNQGDIDSIDATAEELTAANIVPVTLFTGQFPVDGYQYAIEIQQQEDGSWAQVMMQVEIPEAQYINNVAVQAQVVKADRDRMIASTDWVVTKSAEEGIPVSQAWKDYRQALRDIPIQSGFPFNVQWPQLPNR
jgi:hypothetical protein